MEAIELITKEQLFKPNQREVSGFGGSYENGCRDMIIAGVNWCIDNPEKAKHLSYGKLTNVYGICVPNNEYAEELDKIVTKAADGCTGAMHQACIAHILWISAHSIDEYIKEMIEN